MAKAAKITIPEPTPDQIEQLQTAVYVTLSGIAMALAAVAPKNADGRPSMTRQEAADYLSVSPTTIDRLKKSGELKPWQTEGKKPRYFVDQLDAWRDRRKG